MVQLLETRNILIHPNVTFKQNVMKAYNQMFMLAEKHRI